MNGGTLDDALQHPVLYLPAFYRILTSIPNTFLEPASVAPGEKYVPWRRQHHLVGDLYLDQFDVAGPIDGTPEGTTTKEETRESNEATVQCGSVYPGFTGGLAP